MGSQLFGSRFLISFSDRKRGEQVSHMQLRYWLRDMRVVGTEHYGPSDRRSGYRSADCIELDNENVVPRAACQCERCRCECGSGVYIDDGWNRDDTSAGVERVLM